MRTLLILSIITVKKMPFLRTYLT